VQLPRVDSADIAATAERIERRFSSRVLRVAHEAERRIAAEGALLLARVAGYAIELEDTPALLQAALTLVRERLPAARGAIVLRGTDGQLAPAVAQRAPEDPPHLRMKIDQDALRAVLREGAARTGRTEGRTWCCAPLRSRAGVRGAVYVDAPLPATDFGELHAQVLTAVGQVLGLALDLADWQSRSAAGADGNDHRLRGVLDGFAHPTFVLDCDGRIVVCNDAAERLVGAPAGRRLEEMVVLDDQLRFVTELGRAQRGEPNDVTVRVQAVDGAAAPIQCRLVPLYRADAVLDGYAVYARPVTRG
jgi:PAS domain-containing protein